MINMQAVSWWICIGLLLVGSTLSAEQLPVLDPKKQIDCSNDPEGNEVRLQCDDSTQVCLVAPAKIIRKGQPTNISPKELSPCWNSEPSLYADRVAQGFTMTPALNDAPHGFRRDERNRLFQTSFDLRRRFYLGVFDNLALDPFEQSLGLDVGIHYETYNRRRRKRTRLKFLQANLTIAPLHIEAVGVQYDLGRHSKDTNLWITTFIGKPRRFDIDLDLGPGFQALRISYNDVDGVNVGLMDIVHAYINWEMFHNDLLEDFLLVRVGVGTGLRFSENQGVFYLFPEVGAEFAWRAGSRGLTEFRLGGRARLAFEPEASHTWFEVVADATLERIVLAISDQPLTLYAKPSARWVKFSENSEDFDARFMLGGRLNFFVPAPEKRIPSDNLVDPIVDNVTDSDLDGIIDSYDQCPHDPEDFDGFEDSDGCPEIDNDHDGILDFDDACPLQPEDMNGVDDRDGCPEGSNNIKNNNKGSDVDGDGILDVDDACPQRAEDFDGFQDTDGCPETN